MNQLVKPQAATEKQDAEGTDKQDESTTRHLINGDGSVEKADIHQLHRKSKQQYTTKKVRLAVVPVRSQRAGIQNNMNFQPVRSWAEWSLASSCSDSRGS